VQCDVEYPDVTVTYAHQLVPSSHTLYGYVYSDGLSCTGIFWLSGSLLHDRRHVDILVHLSTAPILKIELYVFATGANGQALQTDFDSPLFSWGLENSLNRRTWAQEQQTQVAPPPVEAPGSFEVEALDTPFNRLAECVVVAVFLLVVESCALQVRQVEEPSPLCHSDRE
jgi:hypothetical protein